MLKEHLIWRTRRTEMDFGVKWECDILIKKSRKALDKRMNQPAKTPGYQRMKVTPNTIECDKVWKKKQTWGFIIIWLYYVRYLSYGSISIKMNSWTQTVEICVKKRSMIPYHKIWLQLVVKWKLNLQWHVTMLYICGLTGALVNQKSLCSWSISVLWIN